MNSKLATRVKKLEAAQEIDRPIRYVWVGLDDNIDGALTEARKAWPSAELRTIRWLRHDEPSHAA